MKPYKHSEPMWGVQVDTVNVYKRPDGQVGIKLDNGIELTLDSHDCHELAGKLAEKADEMPADPVLTHYVSASVPA